MRWSRVGTSSPRPDRQVLRRRRRLSQSSPETRRRQEALRESFVDFLGQLDGILWEIHRQIASGGVVMNERTDTLHSWGRATPVRVMGVFEVSDGPITGWRDYFDMAEVNRALGR
ncbi:limonene-1,2-epoxide hydrolase family protein [Streptomyces mirabilis]|uniref:limonene-1,2-epoxide hydrolase family protein n=1 Tax=Streptomyces mirabilis TaxID=68239 RepID=UPI0036580A76